MRTHSCGRTQLLLRTLLLIIVGGMLSSTALAQRSINEADRVTRSGSVHPLARAEFDRGSADLTLPMENMILLLSPRASAKAELDTLLAEQQNSKSPNFHQWLTPQEFGLRFGPSDQDVADAANWLKSFGFRIEEIGNGKLWINFSGNVQQVERAFQTNIRQYEVNGEIHHANATDLSVPRALSGLVQGVVSLHDFPIHRHSNAAQVPVVNVTNVDGSHNLAPGDFATIYNLTPLYNAGIDGTGQTIAIVGRTDIVLGDVQFFRSTFGLPAKDPIFIHNGNAPGDLKGNEELEADLDVEWSGAVAKNATIDFVISRSTRTTDGVSLSAQYIVNNNIAPVMSTSFGLCEASLGPTGNAFWNNLWTQAAAEGITAFVSTGDTGAAGCDANNAAVGTVQAVSGIASTPNNIAVGGTEFNEGAGIFWAAGNNPDLSSALGPIPEIVWNESKLDGGVGITATGGGVSTIYAKPAYQFGPGVPADNFRDIPDVALTAAGHDAYLIVQGHTNNVTGLEGVAGTSAASPSFAGIMALVVQKTGAAQGNANNVLYSMARTQFAGGSVVFNDITSGNNTVPGVAGFSAGVGYDQATGWGSVNAANLVNSWNSNNPDFSFSASPASQSVIQGSSTSYSAIVTAQNGYTGIVNFTVSGLPAGATLTPAPASVTNSGTSAITILTATTTPVGTYPLTITASDGVLSHIASVIMVINSNAPADFTLSATPASQTITAGVNAGYQINVGSVAGFNGLVNLSVSVSPVVAGGPGASINPTSLTGSGLAALTVTTGSTTPAGTYTFTISGSSGALLHSATVTLVVNAQGTGDFSISSSNTFTVKRGQTGSLPITITGQAGFSGTVSFSVSGLPSPLTGTFSPATVTGSGSSAMSVTVGNQQKQGTFQIVITGTSGFATHTATVNFTIN
jgi:pseudomonalisin